MMPAVRRFIARLRSVLHNGAAEADLARELRSHLTLLEDEYRSRGLAPDAARLLARRALGGVEQIKEHHRDARSFRWLEDACRDARYASRLLRRNRLFTLTAALSLAIGIGADTTIFTVANALLFRAPAGVAEPDRLVDIIHVERGFGMADPHTDYPVYAGLRERSTTLEGIYGAELDLIPIGLSGSDGSERIFGDVVTANYFNVLGIAPATGRFFSNPAASSSAATQGEVVLSHRFWTRRFNADPGVPGRIATLNGQPFIVVGVADEAFRGTSVVLPDVWISTASIGLIQPGSSERGLRLMLGGRLRPGVSYWQAAAEVEVLGSTLEREQPKRDIVTMGERRRRVPGEGGLRMAAASPIPANLRGVAAGFFSLLMVLVSLVLLIACANLAGVLLARAVARRREIAVRIAIGASRAHLVRQLLIETLMLFVLGGAAGLLLAREMTTVVVKTLPESSLPLNLVFPLDGRIVLFVTALSLVSAILSGLAPSLQASRADVVSGLRSDEQGPSDRLRLRHAFVIVQVAFSILLVVAGGLLARALERVNSSERGFDARGIELASLDLSLAGYTSQNGPLAARTMVERIRALPGVQTATLSDRALTPGMRFSGFNEGITVPGVAPPDGQPFFPVDLTSIEPGYFSTLRIPLAGRDFGAADSGAAPPVAIVAQATAERLWPGQDPVGKYVQWQTLGPPDPSRPSPSPKQLLVVGQAGDLKSDVPHGEDAPLVVYMPFQQRYGSHAMILARTTHGQRIAGEIRGAVASVDPNLPVLNARSLEDALMGPVETQLQIAASISASVGLVSLLLATIGIYGVAAYAVARRTREIGIRLALGARPIDVMCMILRHGMLLVVVGSAIGLAVAAAASRVLVRLLFGVPPLDPITFLGAAALFAAIGLLASYVPARRATRIDAIEALKYE